MPEAFSWTEGQIWLSSGAAAASAGVGFAQNINAQLFRGWVNHPALSGNQVEYLTGKRADVTLGAFYTFDGTILKMVESGTALHMKLLHSSVNGTAGVHLYSGRVDSLTLNGTDNNTFQWTMQFHAYAWSAF